MAAGLSIEHRTFRQYTSIILLTSHSRHRRHCSGGSGLHYPCVRRPRNLGRCGFFPHRLDSLPIPPCSAPYYMVQFLCVLDNVLHFIHSPCYCWTSIRSTTNIWSLCHSSGSDLCGSSSVSDLFATGVHALNLLQDGLYNILIGFLCERCPWQ